jgi:hypothetical protein
MAARKMALCVRTNLDESGLPMDGLGSFAAQPLIIGGERPSDQAPSRLDLQPTVDLS